MRVLLCAAVAAMLSSSAMATEYFAASVALQRVVSFSSVRPVNTALQDASQIEFSPDPFAGTNCAGGYATLLKADQRLFAIALTAISTKAAVQLAVDDTLKSSGVCQVTAIKAVQ